MGRGKVVSEKRLAESAESLEELGGRSLVSWRSRLVAFKTSKTGEGAATTEFARPIAAVPDKQSVNENRSLTRLDVKWSAKAGSDVFVVLHRPWNDG